MIEIRRSHKEEREALYELWASVFNEDRLWLDRFFALRYNSDHIFVATVDGTLASALHALDATYVQAGRKHRCSYIVGAATDPAYRRQGLMGTLLSEAARTLQVPITLFPAVRPFYEANGYETTSHLVSYPLTPQQAEHQICSQPAVWSALDAIYRQANEEGGFLVRDTSAWEFLIDGYETVSVDGAYAFISEGRAVEAFALTAIAAQSLAVLLAERKVTHLATLASSPLSALFDEEDAVSLPMGMSTAPSMRGVYIAEQY